MYGWINDSNNSDDEYIIKNDFFYKKWVNCMCNIYIYIYICLCTELY